MLYNTLSIGAERINKSCAGERAGAFASMANYMLACHMKVAFTERLLYILPEIMLVKDSGENVIVISRDWL
jgi:hypothetical protein